MLCKTKNTHNYIIYCIFTHYIYNIYIYIYIFQGIITSPTAIKSYHLNHKFRKSFHTSFSLINCTHSSQVVRKEFRQIAQQLPLANSAVNDGYCGSVLWTREFLFLSSRNTNLATSSWDNDETRIIKCFLCTMDNKYGQGFFCLLHLSDILPLMKAPLHPALTTSVHSGQTCCLRSTAPSRTASETTQSKVLRYSEAMIPCFKDSTVAQHCAAELYQRRLKQHNIPQWGTWTTCSQQHPELSVFPVLQYPELNVREVLACRCYITQ